MINIFYRIKKYNFIHINFRFYKMNSVVISFLQENIGVFSNNFRPSHFQYDEGGGMTDEELNDICSEDFSDKETRFSIQSDCLITKEVVRRFFGAIPKRFFKLESYSDFVKHNSSPDSLIENYNFHKYLIIKLKIPELHFLTLFEADGKNYLIQSFADKYLPRIVEIKDADKFIQDIGSFQNDLVSQVVGIKVSKNRKITFQFCKWNSSPLKGLDLSRNIKLMRDESRGYIC